MISELLLSLTLILAADSAVPAASSGTAADGLVRNAITVEGSASLTVNADLMAVEFPIGARGETSPEAIASLGPAQKVFTTAVRRVAGNSAAISFSATRISRFTSTGNPPEWFEARQAATVSISSYPKDPAAIEAFVARLAAAAVESRAVPEGEAVPLVYFTLLRPSAFEQRMIQDAVEDSKNRADLIGKLLVPRFRYVQSAHFPAGVYVNGAFVAFSDKSSVQRSSGSEFVITYTARVAYQREL